MTEEKYILNLRGNGNDVSRNSNCSFKTGGDKITFFITNPYDEDNFIDGVEILLVPYVPNQFLGESKVFEKIKIQEDFRNHKNSSGIQITIPVEPEYSYQIFGSYTTRFGRLTPSESISIEGEFEDMMMKVGCYIRNDFVFSKQTENSVVNTVQSSIDCALSCYNEPTCTSGWSYQIATKRCFFYAKDQEFNDQKLQPSTHLLYSEYTIGWATGLKSCSAAGLLIMDLKKLNNKITTL